MTLADIRDWLKTLNVAEGCYIGKIDASKEKVIGVYQRPQYTSADIAIGGMDATKTACKHISILVHWNRNARETESKAQWLYNNLLCVRDLEIAGEHVDYIHLLVPEPVDIGTDDNGIYERVIWVDLYYQKKQEVEDNA